MKVNAIYSQGRLEFSAPIRFARERFPVVVELPDAEILNDVTPVASTAQTVAQDLAGSKLLAEIQQILGPLYHNRPSASVEDEKETRGEAFVEKFDQ